jgi:hypothetical protein
MDVGRCDGTDHGEAIHAMATAPSLGTPALGQVTDYNFNTDDGGIIEGCERNDLDDDRTEGALPGRWRPQTQSCPGMAISERMFGPAVSLAGRAHQTQRGTKPNGRRCTMHTLTKITTATALATGLLGAPAFAAGWDRNDDQTLSEDEFSAGMRSQFDEYDTNDDGMISRNEYSAAMFDWYDTDESDNLESDEVGVLNGERSVRGLEDINDQDPVTN